MKPKKGSLRAQVTRQERDIVIADKIALAHLYLPQSKVKLWAHLLAFWGSNCHRNAAWPSLSPTSWPGDVPEGIMVVDIAGKVHRVKRLVIIPIKPSKTSQVAVEADQRTKQWPVYLPPTAVELVNPRDPSLKRPAAPLKLNIQDLCDLPPEQLDLSTQTLGLHAHQVRAAHHWMQRLDLALSYVTFTQGMEGDEDPAQDQLDVARAAAASFVEEALEDPPTPQEAEHLDNFTRALTKASEEARWAAKRARRAARQATDGDGSDPQEDAAELPVRPEQPQPPANPAAGPQPPPGDMLARQQVAERSGGQQRASGQAVGQQPALAAPRGRQPVPARSASDQPAAAGPAGHAQPAAFLSASRQPAAAHPASRQPAAAHPANRHPAGPQPAGAQPAGPQPAAAQSAGHQAAADPSQLQLQAPDPPPAVEELADLLEGADFWVPKPPTRAPGLGRKPRPTPLRELQPLPRERAPKRQREEPGVDEVAPRAPLSLVPLSRATKPKSR